MRVLGLALVVALSGCSPSGFTPSVRTPGASASDVDVTPDETDDAIDPADSTESDVKVVLGDCNFETMVGPAGSGRPVVLPDWDNAEIGPDGAVVHAEPAPDGLIFLKDGLVMPNYTDDMPKFARAEDWGSGVRCYRTPVGDGSLDEAGAYELYRDIAELTTGVPFDDTEGRRTVVGVRGASPGTFVWNGDDPNAFNDSLALLWVENGERRVLEFPVTTQTGSVDFGYNSSSQLRPNRHYPYKNGWHKSYNALQMADYGYQVRDDANGNGHWDSDRNGWLNGGDLDKDREGSAHNIHLGSVDAPLSTAGVDSWSAGCQVIPGRTNWNTFIDAAWTGMGDEVDYFLVDVRDIDKRVWDEDCEGDGSRGCPYVMDLPFDDNNDTSTSTTSEFSTYSCSTADESGPERVYVVTVEEEGYLSASVTEEAGVDVDVHILDGDDADACRARGNKEVEEWVSPGRYWIVVDSWTDGSDVFSGKYELNVDFD